MALDRKRPAGEEERRVRVASYNVHRCHGRDGVFDPRRVLRVIEASGAQVAGLQEVDIHSSASSPDILELAAASGFAVIPGPTLLRESSRYGNALLSRLPVVRTRRHDLTVGGREPRGAIDADLDLSGVTLRVIVTHLGLRRPERRLQAKKLLAVLEGDDPALTVLLGDLNEWLRGSRTLRPLERWFGRQTAAPPTFPAGRPVLALDRVLVRPTEPANIVRAFRRGEARIASDHLPVVADVRAGV